MRRQGICFAMVLLICASGLLATLNLLPERARAAVLYVGNPGPGNYTSIQEAVEAANPGDTIYVYNGTYRENVVVSKALTLIGEGRNGTIVDAGLAGTAIEVDANDVSVSGFTFTNSSSGFAYGVLLDSVRNVTISDSIVSSNEEGLYIRYSRDITIDTSIIAGNRQYGIEVDHSDRSTIAGNSVYGNNFGLCLEFSNDSVIEGNNFSENGEWTINIIVHSSERNTFLDNSISNIYEGIILTGSPNNTFIGNRFTGIYGFGLEMFSSPYNVLSRNIMESTGMYFYGEEVRDWNSHSIDTTNRINGRPLIYWKDVVGGVVPPGAGAVILANCSGVTVQGQEIDNTTVGIALGFSSGNLVVDNFVNSTTYAGILVDYSSDNTVARNSLWNFGYGILVESSTRNVVSRNNITCHGMVFKGEGIHVGDSNNITIENNTIDDIDIGVGFCCYTSNITITRNLIMRADQDGIVMGNSPDTKVIENIFLENREGVYVWHQGNVVFSSNMFLRNGIGVLSESGIGNMIYHNSFLYNNIQAMENGSNTWDNGYPSGGNYWSDYGGADSFSGPNQDIAGGDSIGDTPYDIPPWGGTDRYPLIYPVIGPVPPMQPPNLRAVPGDSQISLTWDAPFDGGSAITNYRMYRGLSPGGEALYVTLGNVTAYTDTGVVNRQAYYYRVSAVNAVGEGPKSDEANATPTDATPGPPMNLTVVDNVNKVVLVWSPPLDDGGSPITNYTVYRGVNFTPLHFYATLGNVLTYTDYSVRFPDIFSYRVTANNSLGESPPSNEVFETPIMPPSPSDIFNVTAGDGKITLKWGEPFEDNGAPVTQYTLYRGTIQGGETPHVIIPYTNLIETYTDSGLVNGQTYYYYVTAWNIAGEGAKSNKVNATPATLPGVPVGLTATAGDARATLNWVAPVSDGGSVIINYRIYRGAVPAGETFLIELGNVFTFTDTGLTNGQTYYYEVAASNAIGEGPRSNEASATPATVPGQPIGLMAVPGNGQVALTWSAPASDGGFPVTNYEIFRGTSPTAETFLVEVGDVLTYTDAGLVNGMTYFYEVTAMNAIGEGQKSSEVAATPATVPGQPVGFEALAGNGQIDLTWEAPADDGGSPVTNYDVYRGATSGGEDFLIEIANVLTWTDTGLVNGVTYYYMVSAKNDIGEGPPSAEASAIPATIPSEPLNLVAVAGDGQVLLTWAAPASDGGSLITNYSIYRGTASGGETLLVTLGNVLTFTDTAVTNGQTYYYRVSASNSVGEGGKSSEAAAQPTSGQPTGGKSILEETWFWIVIVAAIIILVAVFIFRRKKGKQHQAESPREEAG